MKIETNEILEKQKINYKKNLPPPIPYGLF